MPPVSSLATAPAAIDAVHNLTLLGAHADDVLAYLNGTSPGDVLFSLTPTVARGSLETVAAAASRGRAGLMTAVCSHQMEMAAAVARESLMILEDRAARNAGAAADYEEDRLYLMEQQVVVGRILSLTSVEQRGV